VAGQREPLARGDTRQLRGKIKTGQNQDSGDRLEPMLEPMEWVHLKSPCEGLEKCFAAFSLELCSLGSLTAGREFFHLKGNVRRINRLSFFDTGRSCE
jgi:hypothetical protein